MKESLVLIFIILNLSCTISLGQKVHLELKDKNMEHLPEHTKVLIFARPGENKMQCNFPFSIYETYKVYSLDSIDKTGKTINTYLPTRFSKQIFFIYAKTPTGQIYFSSNHKGTPECKKIVKGEIYVEKLKNIDYYYKISSLFMQKVNLKFLDFESKNPIILPDSTKIIVLTKDKKEKREIYQFPLPKNYTITEDIYINGQTLKKYTKSDLNGKKYFVYALTPDGIMYYSCDRRGRPFFDLVLKGDILIKSLKDSDIYYEIINYFDIKSLSLKQYENFIRFKAKWSNYLLLFIPILILIILRLTIREKYLLTFIYIAYITSFILFLIIKNINYQLPLIFSVTSLILGIYQNFYEKNFVLKLLNVYKYFILGYAYSFFFNFFNLSNAGDLLFNINVNKNFILNLLIISFATANFVYIFSISFLINGIDNKLSKVLLYLSLFFCPIIIYSLKNTEYVYFQIITIIYLFISTIVAFITGIRKNFYLDNYKKIIILFVLGLFLNFFVLSSIVSFVFYLIITKNLNKFLINEKVKIALYLSIATFIFHILFISFINYFNLITLNNKILFAIIFSTLSLFAIIPLGYSIFKYKSLN